jgi:hypothetical protein
MHWVGLLVVSALVQAAAPAVHDFAKLPRDAQRMLLRGEAIRRDQIALAEKAIAHLEKTKAAPARVEQKRKELELLRSYANLIAPTIGMGGLVNIGDVGVFTSPPTLIRNLPNGQSLVRYTSDWTGASGARGSTTQDLVVAGLDTSKLRENQPVPIEDGAMFRVNGLDEIDGQEYRTLERWTPPAWTPDLGRQAAAAYDKEQQGKPQQGGRRYEQTKPR